MEDKPPVPINKVMETKIAGKFKKWRQGKKKLSLGLLSINMKEWWSIPIMTVAGKEDTPRGEALHRRFDIRRAADKLFFRSTR
jgi:hypothetical protein